MWKKCEKSVKNVENVEKQENTVFNTFPNLNLKKRHSLWTYWHESLKMNICLCGILMFKFNIL